MSSNVGLNETEYLDLVERIQRAMCIEPFCPDVTDVVVLIGTVRMLDQEVKRLRAELHRVAESRRGQRERAERAEAVLAQHQAEFREQITEEHAAYQELYAQNKRLRAAIEAYLENDSQANWDALAALEKLWKHAEQG